MSNVTSVALAADTDLVALISTHLRLHPIMGRRRIVSQGQRAGWGRRDGPADVTAPHELRAACPGATPGRQEDP